MLRFALDERSPRQQLLAVLAASTPQQSRRWVALPWLLPPGAGRLSAHSPCNFFWPLPSSWNTSCMCRSSSMLASDGLVDSHWMLRELKLLNLRPCWS